MPESGRPLQLCEIEIEPRRVSVLGHLRAAEYVVLFDDAFLAFTRLTGLTDGNLRHGTATPFLLDMHITYLKEVRAGERVLINAQVLEADSRRARIFLSMLTPREGTLLATCEFMLLNMDLTTRRTAPWSSSQGEIWGELLAAHAGLPMPSQAGRSVPSLAAAG